MGVDEPAARNDRLQQIPEAWNRLTERIIACAMEVHTTLGPGLLEKMYEQALVHELNSQGLLVRSQVPVIIRYKTIELQGQRLDLVVENLVVIENKAVERVPDFALAQLVSYLRSGGFPLGLLFNFHALHLRDGIFRRVNPSAIRAKSAQSHD